MSKTSELDAVLTELSAHSKALLDAVQSIREILGEEKDEAAPAPKACTLEEVRAALLDKRKAGYKEEVKALLAAHGAQRLTDIDPGEYNAMLQEAGAIGR